MSSNNPHPTSHTHSTFLHYYRHDQPRTVQNQRPVPLRKGYRNRGRMSPPLRITHPHPLTIPPLRLVTLPALPPGRSQERRSILRARVRLTLPRLKDTQMAPPNVSPERKTRSSAPSPVTSPRKLRVSVLCSPLLTLHRVLISPFRQSPARQGTGAAGDEQDLDHQIVAACTLYIFCELSFHSSIVCKNT
jgi:hypothetical protein